MKVSKKYAQKPLLLIFQVEFSLFMFAEWVRAMKRQVMPMKPR